MTNEGTATAAIYVPVFQHDEDHESENPICADAFDLIEQYLAAFDVLVQTDHGADLPSLLMARHVLELGLKEMQPGAGRSHRLSDLLGRLDSASPLHGDLEMLRFIGEMDQVDPGGMSFRYEGTSVSDYLTGVCCANRALLRQRTFTFYDYVNSARERRVRLDLRA